MATIWVQDASLDLRLLEVVHEHFLFLFVNGKESDLRVVTQLGEGYVEGARDSGCAVAYAGEFHRFDFLVPDV